MSLIRSDSNGVIRTAASVPMTRSDGVIHMAASGWRLDDTGVIRKIYERTSAPSPDPIILFYAGIWGGFGVYLDITTDSANDGGAYYSGSDYIVYAMASSGRDPYSGGVVFASPGSSADMYAMLSSHKKLCADLDVSINGIAANPEVTISINEMSNDFTLRLTNNHYGIVSMSLDKLTPEICGDRLSIRASAPFGSDIQAIIHKVWIE